ncbi:MAG TPA: class I SAM-dependent methyltransferase [Ktedonobacteraceae bacterium]|jgi:predicted O-methyltransferase YrrM|nr:class I SAM-dependent methyltransferase [Ktedonobacteraceae bacterium]HZU67058.1 class I SAM-dependent methyltransferase [Ktedonobacteraceae bacterium]
MLDTVNLNPPSILKDIEEATQSIGFTMGSDHQTGSLLRTLATAKPSGNFLELGTGTGLSAAWLLDGMDAHSRLITVDRNETHTAIARRFLGHDSRLTFVTMDGVGFIDSMREQEKTFDFIFADMQPGKYQHLDETLQLLAPGGLYVVDDLLMSSSWEEAHLTRVYHLISTLEKRADLRVTKLNWSVGLMIAAKVG